MPKNPSFYPTPDQLKYYVCLFQLEGHTTWHGMFNKTVEGIERQLKPPQNRTKVTAKKFFEIDRITGTFEEF